MDGVEAPVVAHQPLVAFAVTQNVANGKPSGPFGLLDGGLQPPPSLVGGAGLDFSRRLIMPAAKFGLSRLWRCVFVVFTTRVNQTKKLVVRHLSTLLDAEP